MTNADQMHQDVEDDDGRHQAVQSMRDLLDDLQCMQDEREQALEDARVECQLADKALEEAELSADMRTWTWEQRDAWEGAHFRVREAYNNLRKAKEAL